jgi:predicted anti-sigma-YlaC factor YlaD
LADRPSPAEAARRNQGPLCDDLCIVSRVGDDCEQWVEAISARADGEDPGVDGRLLDAHLATCASCRAFEAVIGDDRRQVAVHEAEVMPDLSTRVSKLTALADRASAWGAVRALLALVALEVIVLALPALVLGEGEQHVHEARHLGAFSVAYGVALLVVVVRPARARTVLPVAAVLGGALFITAVIDLVSGNVPLLNETSHLPELVSVVLIWLLATPGPHRAHRAAADPTAPSERPALRLVDQPDDRQAG